jgi:methylenetetrahydrofolate dehydrogenase (NADP+)/methenyltetrahydrofolate cyclohydrolase/formyltetrahydrofolate synthetase
MQIARGQEPKDVSQLAEEIGLYPSEVLQYGHKKAKIDLSVLKRLECQKSGKYIVVAGYVLYYSCKIVVFEVKYTSRTLTQL